jgi:hypothetical protein
MHHHLPGNIEKVQKTNPSTRPLPVRLLSAKISPHLLEHYAWTWIHQQLTPHAHKSPHPAPQTAQDIANLYDKHPDLHTAHITKDYTVSAARHLTQFFLKLPQKASHTLTVIFNADHARPACQCMWLKPLEELPPHAQVLLTATETACLLPTLKARCHPLLYPNRPPATNDGLPIQASILKLLQQILQHRKWPASLTQEKIATKKDTPAVRDALRWTEHWARSTWLAQHGIPTAPPPQPAGNAWSSPDLTVLMDFCSWAILQLDAGWLSANSAWEQLLLRMLDKSEFLR